MEELIKVVTNPRFTRTHLGCEVRTVRAYCSHTGVSEEHVILEGPAGLNLHPERKVSPMNKWMRRAYGGMRGYER